MCDYQGYEFGATYIDSVCITGHLWDADSCDEPGGAFRSGGEIPCPECNHVSWLESQREEIEERGGISYMEEKPESVCPFPKRARYSKDGEQLKEWWLEGYRDAKEINNADTLLESEGGE